jgi:NAD(P)-dependent dehydrogenase (short-subunit alcohol dehydrogenase family)
VWINNAMTSVLGPVTSITPAEFRRVTEVTYLGVVHGTLAALRRMKPRNEGMILQIGSTLTQPSARFRDFTTRCGWGTTQAILANAFAPGGNRGGRVECVDCGED